MLALTLVLYWLLTDASFRVKPATIDVSGLHYADEGLVRERLADLHRQPNIFRVRTADSAAALATLPQVRSARVTVRLPDAVSVEVTEREPIFVWRSGSDAWLVDREGVLFAPREAASAEQLGSGFLGSALPEVDDARLVVQPPGLGDRLGTVDLVVMRQLLALDAERLRSRSTQLRLRVDEQDGYVLESLDRAWRARFGHYTPTLHPPEAIAAEVQCLAGLLGESERRVLSVTLAPSEDACGTWAKVEPRG